MILPLLIAAALSVRVGVGPTKLVTPDFGYSVAYRTVGGRTTIGVFVYERGRWRNVTPPTLRADGIDVVDDVAFVDRRHGWLAGYNCGRALVHLYGTSDGGRTWQSLGLPAGHSCGGGPTYLSFTDVLHGWMEPVSPNAPEGALFGTRDGGRTWTRLATGPPAQVNPPALPCLAPIRFVSHTTGWMARCQDGKLYATSDGGRRWRRVPIRLRNARFDLPNAGVAAATIATRPPSVAGRMTSVAFAVAPVWSVRATRPVAACPLTPYFTNAWPASVVDARVWWVVAGGVVQVTRDAGRHWLSVVAHGLPAPRCSVWSVSAASATVAWVVAGGGGLYRTSDGGRTWERVTLLR